MKLGGDVSAGAANQRAKSREHFLHAERLRDVIVRPAIDPLNLLVPAAPRRQHQHRRRDAGLAPAPQDRETVQLRQPEVEDHGVVAFGLAEKIGALAVGRAVDA